MLDLIWVVLPYIDVYTLSSFCQRHSFFLAFLFPFLQNARDYENNSNLRSESKYFPNVNEDHKVLCSETQMQFRIGHREIRGGSIYSHIPSNLSNLLHFTTLQPFPAILKTRFPYGSVFRFEKFSWFSPLHPLPAHG